MGAPTLGSALGRTPDAAGRFRFLHAADLHLGSPMLGLEAFEDAPVEALRGATRRAFTRLVEHAIARDVSFVVIAGDLYDGAWREVNTGHFFLREVQRLGQAGVQVYVLHGNHDFDSPIVAQLKGHLPPNLFVFPSDAPGSVDVPGLPVTLHGQSFGKRHVPENLARAYPPGTPGRLNVGVLHTSVGGYAEHAEYAPCAVSELMAHGYDYWALGHVHEHAILGSAPWVVFPGNLQGRSVREVGPKGCVEVACEGPRIVSVERVVLDVVRWHRVTVDLTDALDFADLRSRFVAALSGAVEGAPDRLHAARVVLTGSTRMHGELLANRTSWRATLQAAALQASAERIWLEKLRVSTEPLRDEAADDELSLALRRVSEAVTASGARLASDEAEKLEEKGAALARVFDPTGPTGPTGPTVQAFLPEGQAELSERACALLLDRLRRGES